MALTAVVADEHPAALEAACRLAAAAGCEVVGRTTRLDDVARAIAAHRPDVAIVALHDDDRFALALVERIAREDACAVVLLFDGDQPLVVRAALEHGLDAYADRTTPDALGSAIALARRRGRARRETSRGRPSGDEALVEQAKGVLMARHAIDEARAYELLRREARNQRVSVAAIAGAVVRSRGVMGPEPGR